MHVADERAVGFYALLGAAAFLGGLMRMSAAQALILMEMTSSPQMLPFLMLVRAGRGGAGRGGAGGASVGVVSGGWVGCMLYLVKR